MMTFLSYLFAFLLIIDCLFLGLLVLVQLPKKEAGVGMAFGGGAADALFGAGSGSALTKLTKYSATAFFVLVIGLSFLNSHSKPSPASDLRRALEKTAPISQPAVPPTTTTAPATAPSGPGLLISTPTNAGSTSSAPATSVPAPAPK
jgi:protein translocase SecG subunit